MSGEDERQVTKRVERRDGRLHSIQEVRDGAGKLVSQSAEPMHVELYVSDIAQLVAGACALAIPVAFTEQVWDLGSELPTRNILLITVATVLSLAFFVRSLFYPGKDLHEYRFDFFKRVIASYLTTLAVAMLLLILIDKGPMDDLELAIRRAVLIAFPASFAATAVDYIK